MNKMNYQSVFCTCKEHAMASKELQERFTHLLHFKKHNNYKLV